MTVQPSVAPIEGAMIYRPTLPQRIWRALGFVHPPLPDMSDLDDALGFCEAHMGSRIICVLSIGDRIRALISGKLAIEVATKTDVIVAKAITRSTVAVLPPTYPMSSP